MTVEGPITPAGEVRKDASDLEMSFNTNAEGILSPEVEQEYLSTFSPSGSEFKQADSAVRRTIVSEWIKTTIGDVLPVKTDSEFRASLRDGVVLCKILNHVKPGTITRIVDRNELENATGEVIQNMENVTNFLKGVHAVGLPGDYIFSVADLEDTGPGERLKVADCLLCLKRLSEGKKLTGQYSTPARSPFNMHFRRAHSTTPPPG
eukprot:scaffold440074_cov46-Prasinocladus_malaysianus.AAC.1